MTLATVLMAVACVIALQALILGCINLRRYRIAPAADTNLLARAGRISVCIPARNEEANIEACVRSALASEGVDVEVLCYDDQSTDRTPEILARLKVEDARVRTANTVPLPEGWNGKQHGCWRMAGAAGGSWLLFTDADVRFTPDCIGRSVSQAERSGAALLSTFPLQITRTLGEALFVPLIHFMLLSYLPMGRMRTTLDAASSAGCGQFLLARADAYHTSGGHAAFRDTMHDGIKMPRSFRAAGLRTDLFDGTDVVSCRMYRGFAQCWRGFGKNAFEGLGSVALLIFVTVLHVVGHLLPWAFVLYAMATRRPWDAAMAFALVAIAVALLQRFLFAIRFRQSLVAAILHPVGVLLMTAVQWYSLYLARTGKRAWKGRLAGA